jgi:hypothetical protein
VKRVLALMLGFAVLLAACGPIPRPFRLDEKDATSNPLLRLPDHGGIVVPPAGGLPDAQARALADAVAEALRANDIPANTRLGNRQSLILDLFVADKPGASVAVETHLVDPDGKVLSDGTLSDARPRGGEEPADWMGIAKRVASAIVQAIKPESLAQRELLPVRIAVPEGAPGQGGLALLQALAYHLGRAGVKVTEDKRVAALDVSGEVTQTPVQPVQGQETRRLAVVWRVANGDAELGRVDMANALPLRMIERQWAEISFQIAAASAEAIREIVERNRVAPK